MKGGRRQTDGYLDLRKLAEYARPSSWMGKFWSEKMNLTLGWKTLGSQPGRISTAL